MKANAVSTIAAKYSFRFIAKVYGRLSRPLGFPFIAACLCVVALVSVSGFDAMAQARSSGGYSRSGSGYSRTPSFGGPRVAPRTPAMNGGYARPSSPSSLDARRPSVGAGSSWDRAYSQRQSSDALDRLRRQQDTSIQQRAQPPLLPSPQGDTGWWQRGNTSNGVTRYGSRPRNSGDWYNDRGWSPQSFPGMGQRSFGLWDGIFLGFLLNNLGRIGSTKFFHNHQDDPGYQDWRAQAERQAQTNAELRQQLNELDRRLAERQSEPRDPSYLPSDVPPDIALAPRADARTPSIQDNGQGSNPSWLPWLVIAGGGGLFAVLAWRRRQVPAGEQMASRDRDLDKSHVTLSNYGSILRCRDVYGGSSPRCIAAARASTAWSASSNRTE